MAAYRNVGSSESMIDEESVDLQSVHDTLLSLAKAAYDTLHTFSKFHNLYAEQLQIDGADEGPESISDCLSESSRERWRNAGRSLWMMIRSHPTVFSDSKPSNDSKNLSTKACSGGYIRALAARLILLNGIQTKDFVIPQLRTCKETNVVSILSSDELEFGLKCFSRAGRALLVSANDSNPDLCKVSFDVLSLASAFWKAMHPEDDTRDHSQNITVENNIEEAFDSMALLPDAAALLFSCKGLPKHLHQGINVNTLEQEERASKIIGEGGHIVELLGDLDGFVKNDSYAISHNAKQRFLPILAQTAYKQGNRLARLGDYTKSRECLRISLNTTDSCLATIRSVNATKSKVRSESVRMQEQQMLVISKECLYVLAHTCQAIGKYLEVCMYLSHECLIFSIFIFLTFFDQ